MKKKLTALALCASMIAVMAIGTTLAYFTDVDQNTNEFTIGNVKIDLYETVAQDDGANNPIMEEKKDQGKGDDTNPNIKYENILPGNNMKKIVTVENKDTNNVYVALTIKNENYYNFNDNIDNYYEDMYELATKTLDNNATDKEKVAQIEAQKTINSILETYTEDGQTPKTYKDLAKVDDFMQVVTDAIWSGNGWNLNYTKDLDTTNGVDVRYKMKEVVNEATDSKVEVLGWGYANSTYSNGPAFNYVGDIFESQLRAKAPDMDGNFDTLPENPHTRMWVIYLMIPANDKFVIDLSTTCPGFIDNNSVEAFDNMALDVKAFAIQTAGFTDNDDGYKAAFTELFKEEDCFNY